jgi:hypothetical protein
MLKRPKDTDSDKPDTTREKIDRHLRDINDKISEEDIQHIGTDPTPENPIIINDGIIEIPEEKKEDSSSDEDEPDKEAPSAWEIKD